MNATLASPLTDRQQYRVRLATGPAAAGAARRQVRAAVRGWGLPVDPDVAELLASDAETLS